MKGTEAQSKPGLEPALSSGAGGSSTLLVDIRWAGRDPEEPDQKEQACSWLDSLSLPNVFSLLILN